MDVARFLTHRPLLFHYTAPPTVERLRTSGLWCTNDLLRAYEVGPVRIEQLTTFPRVEPEVLLHPRWGPARLSHQRPMLAPKALKPLGKLEAGLALTNTQLEDFCRMLARRVFLFAQPYNPSVKGRPANGFVRRVLHDGPLCEVALNTAGLLALCERNGLAVELSAHNAGSAPQGAVVPKGRTTWVRIEEFSRGVDDIREVVVEGSLPPLADVIESERLVEA